RQIGSAIKPFIYATAIDHGMTPLTIKWDAPVKFKTASGGWAPHNYKPEYLGPVTLRTAIAKSINTVSAQLVAQFGVDQVAGKTGTSTNYRDAWFYGFTADLLCGVWVGRDDFKPIGHDATGGQVSLPIWLDFMRTAIKGQPVRDFPAPAAVVLALANPDNGEPAAPNKPKSRLIPFKRGTLPPAFRGGGGFADQSF